MSLNFVIKFASKANLDIVTQTEWDRAQVMKKLEEIRSGLCI